MQIGGGKRERILSENNQVSKVTRRQPAKLAFHTGCVCRSTGKTVQGLFQGQALGGIPAILRRRAIWALTRNRCVQSQERIGGFDRGIGAKADLRAPLQKRAEGVGAG